MALLMPAAFDEPGEHTITMVVTDAQGETCEASTTIVVAGTNTITLDAFLEDGSYNCVFKVSDDAENLKNQKIFASKDKFPKTKSNEYYVDDLIGCNVVHKNQTFIGNVISVDNFGAGDLLEINFKENKIYIPLNDDNVISVDIENKKILVNPIKGIIDNA